MTATKNNLAMWHPLVVALEFTARNSKNSWTVQTHSRKWEFGPYLKAQYVGDRIYAEITSNNFLLPGLSPDAEGRLQFLGWHKPSGLDHPNWFIVVPHTVQGHETLANLWIRSLFEVYGLDPHWRFTVKPLSIEFIRAWRSAMMPSRAISTFKLQNSDGLTQQDVRNIPAEVNVRPPVKPTHNDVPRQIEVLLSRAKKLGLAGTDLIRLAQCEASSEVVRSVTALVYGSPRTTGVSVSKEDIYELDLYRSLEFDEIEGQEFAERNSDFDHDYSRESKQ
jgi:hypothetical protein